MKLYFFIFFILFIFVAVPVSRADIFNLTMSPDPPYTADNLDCFWKINGNYNSYTVNITWKKNNVTQGAYDNSVICVNDTLCSTGKPVQASDTTKHEWWNCSIAAYNGTDYFESSVVKEIKNSPPNFGVYDPTFNIYEKNLTFTKSYATTDDDGDSKYYSVVNINKTKNYACYGGSAQTGTASIGIGGSGILQISAATTRTVVGEYSIFIIAWDSEFDIKGINVNFSINCSYVSVSLNSMSDQIIEFNRTYSIQATTSGDAVNRSFSDNATFFDINKTSGLMSFAINNESFVGVHVVNISVNDGDDLYDPGNYSSSRLVNFTTVQPPVIDWANVTNNTGYFYYNDTLRRIYIFQNSTVFFNQSSHDAPLNPGSHNLSYSWKLGATEKSTGISWTFSPGSSESGNYTITLTVRNQYSLTDVESWNITINKSYRPPVFIPNLRPKLVVNHSSSSSLIVIQPADGDTYITSSNTTANYANNKTLIVMNNYKSLLKFDLSTIPTGGTIYSAELKLFLYSNSDNSSVGINVYRVNRSWNVNYTTWSNATSNETWNSSGGDYNSTLINSTPVSTRYEWFSWNVTSLVQGWYNSVYPNYGMILTSSSAVRKEFASNEIQTPIPEQKWKQNTIFYSDLYLNNYFFELDGNPLTYIWDDPTYINISIDGYTRVIFNPDPMYFGTDYTTFYATNEMEMMTESNLVTLVVEEEEFESREVPIPRPETRTRIQEVEKIASISILITSLVTADPTQNITLPLKIANTGQMALNDIDLFINTTGLENYGLELKIKDNHFDSLLVGEQRDTEVFINTKNAEIQRYNITIVALVGSPSLYASTQFYVDILELPQSLQKKLRLVQDLFKENPECMELQSVLNEIDTAVRDGKYDRAESLIDSATRNCRALIRYKPVERATEIDIDFIRNVALILFALIMFSYAGIRVLSYRRKRKYKKS